jgi:hypothetical protein
MSVQSVVAPTSAAKSAPLPTSRDAASGTIPSSLLTWYLGLIPYWMEATPVLKRRLLLRTHQWIVDRVLAPEITLAAALTDLRPDGDLTQILVALVPADQAMAWRHFIRVVVANLRHALQLPVTRRNEAWVRWLFLIPYSANSFSADRRAAAAGS